MWAEGRWCSLQRRRWGWKRARSGPGAGKAAATTMQASGQTSRKGGRNNQGHVRTALQTKSRSSDFILSTVGLREEFWRAMGSNRSSAKIAGWRINWRAREEAGNPVGGCVGPGTEGWMGACRGQGDGGPPGGTGGEPTYILGVESSGLDELCLGQEKGRKKRGESHLAPRFWFMELST